MDIRSITLFCEPDTNVRELEPFIAAARSAFSYPVQTVRLATTPFPVWLTLDEDAPQKVADLAQRWQAAGIDYAALGPVQLTHDPAWIGKLSDLLGLADMVFASVEIADRNGQIDVDRCRQTAQLMRQVSTTLDNGFGNLYLTAVANCPPGSPFFPVAYHQGGPPHFALAVESADLALQAVRASHDLSEARQNLVQAIETAAQALTETAVSLARTYNLPFGGIDFSLAPFPTADKSLGGALEALGIPFVGAAGSLFAAGFITEAIERADFQRCGFSGLMLPVLEDSVLARRAAAGVLGVADLLSTSAVCGVGLDTIPLPGDVSEAALTAVLLDVAMLASRLNKPLTARLMPLPGLQVGDAVTFDFPYFADSRVMSIAGDGVSDILNRPLQLQINKIQK